MYNVFERGAVGWAGTNAERLAFTPDVDPTVFFETDTGDAYWWDGAAWNGMGGGGGGGHIIDDEGVPLPAEPVLDFQGAGVTAVDNAGVSTIVTIPGGGHTIADEGVPLAAEPVLDFQGTGVTVTDNAGVSTIVTIPSGANKEVVFLVSGTLGLASGGLRIYDTMGINFNVTEVEIAVNTAPTGAAITVDIHKNGVTIFTNQAHRPTIAIGAFQGTTVLIDVPAWNDGDYLTMDIDGIGSVIAGANLTVMVRIEKV